MVVRIVKWLALIIGALIGALAICIGLFLIYIRIEFEQVNITDALLRKGRYDPAQHFVFERACIFPPESSAGYSLLEARGYRHIEELVYLPDTFVHWSVALIDDNQKTYRLLFAIDPLVKSPGLVCNSRITLRTEMIQGKAVAYVEEAREH